MAEEVAYAIAEWISEDYVFAQALASGISYAAFAASVYTMREQQRRSQNAARNAYNASLKDRYVMVRSATEPRAVVLGRQRVSGPVIYVGSYGAYSEHLVLAVALAGHQIDGVEEVYFDNERVSLDGGGNVQAVNRQDLFTITTAGATFTLTSQASASTVSAVALYGSTQVTLGASLNSDGVTLTVTGGTAGMTGTVTVTYQPVASPWLASAGDQDLSATLVTDSFGAGSVVLSAAPMAGSVNAYYRTLIGSASDAGDAQYLDGTVSVSVAGLTASVSGAPASTSITVTYRVAGGSSRARVRSYLGTAEQSADASMVANLPGVWTSAHTLTGVAYLVCEFDYNADAFPSGIPNVSAVVRGALCYDPRTSTTAWSQNPALLMRYAATSPLLGRLSPANVDDASIIVAANVCDQSTAYVVGAQTYTRPLYTAGIVAKANSRATDVLNDLALAMAGKWVFSDGMMRVRSGAYSVPLMTLNDSWLSDAMSVQVQGATPRADLVNVITGKFVDEQRGFIEVDYPRVAAAPYITADGAELPQDVVLNAVTFSGQAQQVVGCLIRDSRFGMRVTLTCNMRAYPVQVFDTLYVTLARFGWVNQVMEVLGVSYSPDGGIQLTLKATDPSIWALGATFSATSTPPNTLFPSPWNVPSITGLTCDSGTGQLLTQKDGTVVNRIKVTWNALTDTGVLNDGGVEVRYGPPSDPEAQWISVFADRGQTAAYLSENIKDGLYYLVKARAYNSLVKGPWCLPVSYRVAGKTTAPSDAAGLSATFVSSGIRWTWTPCTDADYGVTEARLGGADWLSAAVPAIFIGTANGFVQSGAGDGPALLWVKHRNTSDNESNIAAKLQAFNGRIYKQASSAPSAPSGGTYDFTAGTLTPPTGWVATQPATSATPTYECDYVFATTTVGAAVTAGTWGAPYITDQLGSAAVSAAQAYLYQWSTTAPGDPSGTSTYTWATASNGSYTGGAGWQTAPPSNPGTPGILLWVCAKGVTAAAGSLTSSVDWASGFTKYASGGNGATGGVGASGYQSGTPTVYQWAVSIPAAPSGSQTYTWASSSFGAAPAGWTLTPGTAPSVGYTLWAAAVTLTDVATNATTAFNWSTATVTARGYAGQNGSNGSAGASARIAYAVVSSASSPAGSPNPLTLSGDSLPPSNTWGMSDAWGTTVPAYSAGQTVYQTDGIYNPVTNQAVWGLPYISSLKVGSLAAITVNTGALNVTGNLTMSSTGAIIAGAGYGAAGGWFAGYSGGAYKFSLGNALTFDGTTLTIGASSISGLAPVATSGTLPWGSVTGVPSNVSNATVNRVFTQATAPTGTLYAGDIWNNTSPYGYTTETLYYNGSSWISSGRAPMMVVAASSSASWSDSEASAAIVAKGGGYARPGDVVNLYNESLGWGNSRMLSMSSDGWVDIALRVSGNEIINGTLSAAAIITGQVFAGVGLRVGSATRSGTTMSGSGAVFAAAGDASIGGSNGNITVSNTDGKIYLNGAIVYPGNIALPTFSATIGGTWTKDTNVAGDQSIGTVSISVSGGTGAPSYLWTVSDGGNTANNADRIYIAGGALGSSVALRGNVTLANEEVNATVSCTVTDSTGRTITQSVEAWLLY